jgi:hypothetical protein
MDKYLWLIGGRTATLPRESRAGLQDLERMFPMRKSIRCYQLYCVSLNVARKVWRPASEQEMRQLIKQMDNKYGFPQTFGCLNGTHIPIHILQKTRKLEDFLVQDIQSINIQAVCNWKGIFLYFNFFRS